MNKETENIDFGKLDKFSKISDNMLSEMTTDELLKDSGSDNETNVEPEPEETAKGENKTTSDKEAEFRRTEGEGSTINVASFLTPEMTLEAIDALIPLLFVWGLSAVKLSIDKKQLQLTPKEKETILPLVEDCLKELQIFIKSPFVALGLMLMIFYGSKAMQLSVRAKETKKEAKTGETAIKVKDTRGRKKGTTKEVIEERKNEETKGTV